MNGILPSLILGIAALALFFVLGWVGFKLKPKLEVPEFIKNELVVEQPIDKKLPKSMKTFYTENIGDPVLIPSSVVAWGRGSMLANRIPFVGQMWLPLCWKLYMVPGEAFNFQVKVTWYTRTFFKGSDSYRDGRGRFGMGTNTVINANVDRSEQILMWLLSFLVSPMSILAKEGATWEQGEKTETSDSAKVSFLSNEGDPLSFTFIIDPKEAEINKVETSRLTAKSGKWLPFHALYGNYRQNEEGVFLPTTMTASWEGDDYLKLEVVGLRYNVNVGEDMLPAPIPEPEPEPEPEAEDDTEDQAPESASEEEYMDEYAEESDDTEEEMTDSETEESSDEETGAAGDRQ